MQPDTFFAHDGRVVATSDRTDTLYTIDLIISEALYQGLPAPTRAEALAAAMCCADGAPISMVLVNIGAPLADVDAARMEDWNRDDRANGRAFRRGSRY